MTVEVTAMFCTILVQQLLSLQRFLNELRRYSALQQLRVLCFQWLTLTFFFWFVFFSSRLMRCILPAVFAVLLFVSLASARVAPRWNELTVEYTYAKYAADFGKSADVKSTEYKKREQIFNDHLREILQHNSNPSRTFHMGVNQFSDWTHEEKKAYNKFKAGGALKNYKGTVYKAPGNASDLPKTVDYRTSVMPNVLTAIKNQGACGNCWSWSTIESIESHFALKTGQLPVLSAQQVTSCDTVNYGCGGGDYFDGWAYVQNSTGLNEEWLYPFTDFFVKNATKNGTAVCRNITKDFLPMFPWYPKATVTGYTVVNPNDAHSAMHALLNEGPLSIAVAAEPWMGYEGGILSNNASNPTTWEIDHAVQLVGYGHDPALDMNYWIVKNSWGTQWGEDGFIRLARPDVEPCTTVQGVKECGTTGLLSYPGFPNVAEIKKKNP